MSQSIYIFKYFITTLTVVINCNWKGLSRQNIPNIVHVVKESVTHKIAKLCSVWGRLKGYLITYSKFFQFAHILSVVQINSCFMPLLQGSCFQNCLLTQWLTQPFILLRLIKWVPGTPGELVIKNNISS